MARKPHKLCARLDDDERALVEKNLDELGYRSLGHFVRTMLVHGRVYDFMSSKKSPSDRKELIAQFQALSLKFSHALEDFHKGDLEAATKAQSHLPEIKKNLIQIDELRISFHPTDFARIFSLLGKAQSRFHQGLKVFSDDSQEFQTLRFIIKLSKRIRSRARLIHGDN